MARRSARISNTASPTLERLLRSSPYWAPQRDRDPVFMRGMRDLANYQDYVEGLNALQEVEDGRRWHPDPEHGALTIGGRFASVTVHSRPAVARSQILSRWGGPRGIPVGFQVPVGIKYAHSFNVINCVRRKTRREVILAKKKHRIGAGAKKHRTWRSAIWC